MTEDLINETEDTTELMGRNFIHDIIDQDLAPDGRHH